MNGSNVTRVDVFIELTRPQGTFDFEKCNQILGDRYDSFIDFCNAVKVIPEEIDTMEVTSFGEETLKANYRITMTDGKVLELET